MAPITRVEMRYKREARRELGCDGVEETLERLDALWAYSTQKWLRHTVPNPADRRRSRWESSAWWRAVQGRFGAQQTTSAVRKKAHAYQEERLGVTLLGYLESLCAYRAGRRPKAAYSLERTARAVVAEARQIYAERHTDFISKVRKKHKR